MQMTSCTAVNCNHWKLGSWSAMQESKPGGARKRTSERVPGLLWTGGTCFWACQLAVWSSWASNVADKFVLVLSGVDRGFKFTESSFLGIRKRWSLQQAISLQLCCSFKLCVTSHNTMLHHQFLNCTEQKRNRLSTRLFFPPCVEK